MPQPSHDTLLPFEKLKLRTEPSKICNMDGCSG